MTSSLIVARMEPSSAADVRRLFAEFDQGDLPHQMGTQRRRLFHFHGLYFHLQDFADDRGAERIESAKEAPRFVQISADLRPFITPYDPATWRSPSDAMAECFYDWSSGLDEGAR